MHSSAIKRQQSSFQCFRSHWYHTSLQVVCFTSSGPLPPIRNGKSLGSWSALATPPNQHQSILNQAFIYPHTHKQLKVCKADWHNISNRVADTAFFTKESWLQGKQTSFWSTHNAESTIAKKQKPDMSCQVCGLTTNLKSCGSCLQVNYCSREHQIAHWKDHKPWCRGSKSSKSGIATTASPVKGNGKGPTDIVIGAGNADPVIVDHNSQGPSSSQIASLPANNQPTLPISQVEGTSSFQAQQSILPNRNLALEVRFFGKCDYPFLSCFFTRLQCQCKPTHWIVAVFATTTRKYVLRWPASKSVILPAVFISVAHSRCLQQPIKALLFHNMSCPLICLIVMQSLTT